MSVLVLSFLGGVLGMAEYSPTKTLVRVRVRIRVRVRAKVRVHSHEDLG